MKMTYADVSEAMKNETPEAELFLLEIATQLGFEEIELFDGSTVKLERTV